MAATLLACWLLYRTLGRYDLDQLKASVMAVPAYRPMLAGEFAAASYFCLTWFDCLGTHHVGKPLSYPRAALTSFTSLALGHSIGLAALSSGAVRFRFYNRWGYSAAEVAKLILFCAATVTGGLTLLAGVAVLLRPDLGQEVTRLDHGAVIALGVACLALILLYLGLATWVRRPLRLRS